jgi:hypothetical protein
MNNRAVGSMEWAARFRTREEILYDDHVAAHNAEACLPDCLVCRDLDDIAAHVCEELDKEK